MAKRGPPVGKVGRRDAKIRTCLRCSKEFNSSGRSNRICSDCNRLSHSLRYNKTYVATIDDGA